jgi:hypothetical protein
LVLTDQNRPAFYAAIYNNSAREAMQVILQAKYAAGGGHDVFDLKSFRDEKSVKSSPQPTTLIPSAFDRKNLSSHSSAVVESEREMPVSDPIFA